MPISKRRGPVHAEKSRRERCDGVETREAILAAAEQEFADKGFELASAREICRRARANSALMNRYFGSKEALYRLAAKRLFGDLGAPLATLADGTIAGSIAKMNEVEKVLGGNDNGG